MIPRRILRRLQVAVAVQATAIYLLTAPGRIPFPDDEIVVQTTISIAEGHSFAIPGIERRSGEVRGQKRGTFGWAAGRDGRRYGFFGHGLSLAALPAYYLAKLTYPWVPETWRYAVRSDHMVFHRRGPFADWVRLVISLTNCAVTGWTAALLLGWLALLGFGARASTLTALAYALGTAAWPFSRTFLSEPLSAFCLLLAAFWITRYHRQRGEAVGARWLWLAAALTGLLAQVHVLNLSALPGLIVYALGPSWRQGGAARLWIERRLWGVALLIGLVALGSLGLSHYLRFGSPWETGRFGIYSHSVAPWIGLAALFVAPGRSLFLYAPAVTLGLAGAAALRRRLPHVACFALAMVVIRALVIATRSDWYGGWALGPRHLIPVLPFAILPLAALWEAWPRWRRAPKVALAGLQVGAVAVTLYLSLFSIFEWMFHLSRDPAIRSQVPYMQASHWWLSASPLAGFYTLKVDMLSVGAWRLAERGHWGLLVIFAGIATTAVGASIMLWRTLRRTLRQTPMTSPTTSL